MISPLKKKKKRQEISQINPFARPIARPQSNKIRRYGVNPKSSFLKRNEPGKMCNPPA
jgi:hypothetical protein